MKRRGRDSPSTFAEEQAKYAAEQIDVLTNLGESLLQSLQGMKSFWIQCLYSVVIVAPSIGCFKLVLLVACQMG